MICVTWSAGPSGVYVEIEKRPCERIRQITRTLLSEGTLDQTEIPLNKEGYRTIKLTGGSIVAACLTPPDFYPEIFIV